MKSEEQIRARKLDLEKTLKECKFMGEGFDMSVSSEITALEWVLDEETKGKEKP